MNVSLNEIPENKEFPLIARSRFKKYFQDLPSLLQAVTISLCSKITSNSNIAVVSGSSSILTTNKKSHIIYAFGSDYDSFVMSKYESNQSLIENNSDRYIVFLDQDLTRNISFSRSEGFECLGHKKYIESIRYLFESIEKTFNCRVIVAMHPRANLTLTEHDFLGYQVVNSNTLDVVKNSLGVITVGSSSISFAVMHSKPILFITSDEMEDSGYINHNAAPISNSLQLTPLNIDKSEDMTAEKLNKYMKIGAYSDYANKFLCSEFANKERRLWEIIMHKTEEYMSIKHPNTII